MPAGEPGSAKPQASAELMELIAEIERLWEAPPESPTADDLALLARFRAALDRGEARAAEPDPASPSGWRTNPWVKRGILLGFRLGRVIDMSVAGIAGSAENLGRHPFFDKETFPLRPLTTASGVRLVPGGSSIRDGVYLGKGVICMPPMYINVGAYVDDGTVVDSHALVGSCAQVGKRVHLSAAAQLGGVIEPVGALPVIVEDEVVVGGNCGVYEGTVVKRRAVLASGTILTRSTPIYDLVKETIHRSQGDGPLVVPEGAVVVPGARAVTQGAGREWGLSLATPVIVKYRNEGTNSRVQLEDWLR